jgi:hypothetical protein
MPTSDVCKPNLPKIFPISSLENAQGLPLDGFVEDSNAREKFNLALPRPFMEELDRLAAGYGPGRKWLALSAAMLYFIEAPPEVRDYFVERVMGADLKRSFRKLIEDAKRASAEAPPPDLEEQGGGGGNGGGGKRGSPKNGRRTSHHR